MFLSQPQNYNRKGPGDGTRPLSKGGVRTTNLKEEQNKSNDRGQENLYESKPKQKLQKQNRLKRRKYEP